MPRSYVTFLLIVIVLASAGMSGCAGTKDRDALTGERKTFAYSIEDEVQLGREADGSIIAEFGLYDNAALTAYVNEIGQRLVEESHFRRNQGDPAYAQFQDVDFYFRVLDSPVVNAFALPGGYIYVTRGLLAHLENEAQLAVVLGHEIGHVIGRHHSERALAQQRGQLGLLGGAILGQVLLGGSAAENILNIGGTGAQLLFLSWGRDAERESDQLGVEYAALEGYAAGEGAEFFRSLERIGEASGQSIPNWMSSHPDPGEREQTIRQMASEWDRELAGPMNTLDTEEYKQQIEGLVVGEDPRQGFTESGTFFHPQLRFQFPVPRGFEVINQPSQVVMVGPNQEALMIFTFAQASTPQEAAQQFASQQGITVIDQGTLSTGVGTAYSVIADAQTEQGAVRLQNTFVSYGGNVYSFLGYAAGGGFQQYQSAFQSAPSGFRELTDARYLNVQPTRLNILRTTRSAPFSSYLGNLPADFSPEEVAIMNQVELGETIPSGALLKIPRN
jgi:predicted Zn-dependent protease